VSLDKKGRVITYAEVDGTRHDKLVLPDGRRAIDVRLTELRYIMADLGVTGITPQHTKTAVLDLWVAASKAGGNP
jgi:hypothetical protein